MDLGLKERLRAIAEWTLPPRIEGILVQLYARWLMRGSDKNRELHNRHAGEARCFVVGNGPSLRTHDITVLRNEFTIVANSFFMHPDCATVAPKYCCVGDPRFMNDDAVNVAWFKEIEKALPGSVFFVHSRGRTLFKKYSLFNDHEVYFRNAGYPTHRAGNVEIDLRHPLNVGMTTASAFAIPLAIYLGFPRIYLVGCDANWLADPWGKGGSHFYEKSKFFPQYDRGVNTAEELEIEIENDLRDLESHRLIRDRVRPRGTEIINATKGGWLEMYPRVTFESLFD
jgi:hypothetical protein